MSSCRHVLHLHRIKRLEAQFANNFKLFVNRKDELSPNQFQRVLMNDIPVVEDLLKLKILQYDIDILDGKIIGELARRTMQKYENTMSLLR